MAVKKSELYASLWESCDDLRGGMDAGQYKDYVLVMLFIKYISDKYGSSPYAAITVPEGSSFNDMVALKGKTDIGDQINKRIIAPLAASNDQLSQADFPDFNDANKLGSGRDMVDRLTKLIATFEDKRLDFSKNRADGDDILGDAYEYLMRHFATESGKSKGQFYTPAEVSRIMAQIVGIKEAQTTTSTTVYDPTCGSGSLLLKVADEADTDVTLYGQEKDSATTGLARMNMILHHYPTALVTQGNTLADPKYRDGEGLKTFDFVVANPPFSDKRWTLGVEIESDPFERFVYGTPPGKQGDYAYLLHILRSLKSTGKGACILPHGVLFRGNAESDIRRNLVKRGLIKGVIGLPANLFYGTGIPACIVLLDKEHAAARKGIFMVDASTGFTKDGPKNRLRAMDIHKIVDTFNRQEETPGYARMVTFGEIEKNDYNLNIPRYIDTQQAEDVQDIDGHLRGGIPCADVDALESYWQVCPTLKSTLFHDLRPGYAELATAKDEVRRTVYDHDEFRTFRAQADDRFSSWQARSSGTLRALEPACKPKEVIAGLGEDILAYYADKPLIDPYDVYQHLMTYWAETMQDDLYLISADGWKAETYRVLERDKKGNEKDKGWACDLVPKPLVVARYFAAEQDAISTLETQLETAETELAELEEEHGGDEGAYTDLDKVNKANVTARLKELTGLYADGDTQAEVDALNAWLRLSKRQTELKKQLKDAAAALDQKAYTTYPELTEADIKTLVVDDKWMTALGAAVGSETERVSQRLTSRVRELAERYETPLPEQAQQVEVLEAAVMGHLEKMGYRWN